MRSLAFCLLAAAFSAASPSAAADLTVTVRGLSVPTGTMRAALWNGAEGFPRQSDNAVQQIGVVADGDPVALVFSDVEPGVYAVSVHHDRNGNGDYDRNFFGIPREGVGISNNAIGLTGPRSFERASFGFSDVDAEILIDLYHW